MELSKRTIMQRIDDIEDDYKRQMRRLEAVEEDMRHAGNQFLKTLDVKAERLRFMISNYAPETIPPLSHGYNMITRTHDEAIHMMREELEKIEAQREDIEAQYRKDIGCFKDNLMKIDRESEE
ncbi:hypothetical protein [Listeria sp. ILCC797]|uniref:hypothetical protein n=1 Tax=Listeria sp. ILCC797 TaxID=1918333 RepID=UPI000B593EB0|nr:hypothetical protein [Listeria sp. ILCC797]